MAWSADQYLKFENERTRPARDLLAQVPLALASNVIDLGCGPGNSTELLVERFGVDAVSGLDSDRDMLDKARARLPHTRFAEADLSQWVPPADTDLLFANAVLQWIPDHLALMQQWLEALSPGAVLAVQMPDNLDEPSHRAMTETAAEGPWATRFTQPATRRAALPPPSAYYDRLKPLAGRVDIWHTIYNHPMADAQAIVEWVRGTGLRPYLAAAGMEHEAAFLSDYTARIDRAYPPLVDGRRLLRFPRLFVVAIRA